MHTHLASHFVSSSQHFEVDPEVKVLEKQLSSRERSAEQKNTISTFWVAFAVCTPFLVWMLSVIESKETSESSHGTELFLGLIAGLLGLCFVIFKLNATPEVVQENKERRAHQRSIKRSVKAARTLGSIEVLSKEHVDASLRLDNAIAGQHLATSHNVWHSKDIELVRAMLLADLSREDTIVSLITERGATNAQHVSEGLSEMEAAGKPLQEGWL